MDIINMFNLSVWQWVWVILTALLVGFSKTGIGGATMPVIPIIAAVFGGKESTGILLPMLLVGDIFALFYYNRHAKWNNIKKLLPWAFVGLSLGVVVGNYTNDAQFKIFIAISVFICLILLVYSERKGDKLKVPTGTWFYALTGVVAGFTSMIGNAAGPIFSVYLLAKGFKKNDFMGTTAWYFFITNFAKLLLQIFFWHNITVKTMMLTLGMLPAITIGAIIGALVIKKLKEKTFRYIIIAMTFLAAIRLLI